MIVFHSPTELPIEAATTMGVSVKESGNAIGKFGTGIKYAIAGILRLGGSVVIDIAGDVYEFTSVDTDIRGKKFGVVHCNGSACGFTTDLGKHWHPWQLFRELASNSLDESGGWGASAPDDAVTVINVRCREVEEAGRDESVFLPANRRALLESSVGATVHEGPSQHYYFRGIRAGSFGVKAPVTVNITNGELSEDRLLDMHVVHNELAWAFRSATAWDRDFLRSVVIEGGDGDFWVQNVNKYVISGGVSPGIMAWMEECPKTIQHPAFREAYRRHKRSAGGLWEPCEWPSLAYDLVDTAERLCANVSIDPIPRDKLFFTRDLDDGTLAVTVVDSREVWLSTKLVMLGRDEFLAGYIEEAVHAMTGYDDCTRNFQNVWIGIVVRLGLRSC